MKYKEANTPQEYLEHVLNHWTAFCEVNTGLAQAISDLLKVNAALVDAVKVLADEIKEQKENR